MFTKELERKIYLALAVLVFAGAIGVAFGSYVLWPSRREAGYQPEQPIPFSHKMHAGELQIDCLYCHSGADAGQHATVPSVKTCMNCHFEVKTKDDDGELTPGIKTLLDHWDNKKPILWNKVHDLADFAYFDHGRHTAAGVDCRECHGEVEEMEHMSRIYGQKMSWCLDCHTDPPTEEQLATRSDLTTRAPIHCTTCHR